MCVCGFECDELPKPVCVNSPQMSNTNSRDHKTANANKYTAHRSTEKISPYTQVVKDVTLNCSPGCNRRVQVVVQQRDVALTTTRGNEAASSS